MLQEDRAGYETFWKNFGRQIKYGVVGEYGAHKDLLQDLLLFYSSTEKKPVTLDEYVGRMKEDQKYLYYAAGESLDKIDKLPQTELLKDSVRRFSTSRKRWMSSVPDSPHLQG